jgi:hypothetical protein
MLFFVSCFITHCQKLCVRWGVNSWVLKLLPLSFKANVWSKKGKLWNLDIYSDLVFHCLWLSFVIVCFFCIVAFILKQMHNNESGFFFVICGDLMFYNLSSQVLIFELCACFFFFFCTLFFFLWGKFVNYKGKGRTFCICSDLLCCFSSSEEPLIISLLLAPHCLYFQMHLWNYGNERNLLASSIFGDY